MVQEHCHIQQRGVSQPAGPPEPPQHCQLYHTLWSLLQRCTEVLQRVLGPYGPANCDQRPSESWFSTKAGHTFLILSISFVSGNKMYSTSHYLMLELFYLMKISIINVAHGLQFDKKNKNKKKTKNSCNITSGYLGPRGHINLSLICVMLMRLRRFLCQCF